uniref:Uncharacterized protein n=1 Tax=Caenorhabditis japonica TaxID=281687 RepID=A0A8R1I0D6_CAEJA
MKSKKPKKNVRMMTNLRTIETVPPTIASSDARINDRAERPNVRGLHNPAFYEFTYRHFFDTDSVGCPSLRPARRRSLRLLLENGIFDESVSEDDSSSHI